MMVSMLNLDAVETVDVVKLRQALWLFAESGLPKSALENVRYHLSAEQCANCQRWYPRAGEKMVIHMPTWVYKFERGRQPNDWPSKAIREKIWSFLEGHDPEQPPVKWSQTCSCPSCIIPVANMLVEHAMKMKKRLFNAFCLILSRTISHEKSYYGSNWMSSPVYCAYVAVINALLQHIDAKGNSRALRLIIEASHTLGML